MNPPTGSVKAVSAGEFHTCAIRADDSIACWGEGSSGETTPPAGSFTALSLGTGYSCGVDSTQRVWCWGSMARQPLW